MGHNHYRMPASRGRVARRGLALLPVWILLLLLPAGAVPWTGPAAAPSTIWVVRHAERSPEPPDDPHLSQAGARRATLLAEMLAGEPLAVILSTDTRRTRETAAPLAAAAGVEVLLYDPRNAASLDALLDAPGTAGRAVLVVGHSNTVPGIVERLSGTAVEPISEDEYTRLYRLDPSPNGGWRVTLIRFGEGSGG